VKKREPQMQTTAKNRPERHESYLAMMSEAVESLCYYRPGETEMRPEMRARYERDMALKRVAEARQQAQAIDGGCTLYRPTFGERAAPRIEHAPVAATHNPLADDVAKLRAVIPMLEPSTHAFANGLADYYDKHKYLTAKQMKWVGKLIDRADQQRQRAQA
jgi:hypothetical protein